MADTIFTLIFLIFLISRVALSQLLILSWAFSCSLARLQNHSYCESLINSFGVPEGGGGRGGRGSSKGDK